MVGSPTTSQISQNPPPLASQQPISRDPVIAASEWRSRDEDFRTAGKRRRHRPGVVFDVDEEQESRSGPGLHRRPTGRRKDSA